MNYMILIPIFLPMIAGILLLISSFYENISKEPEERSAHEILTERHRIHVYSGVIMVVSSVLAIWLSWIGEEEIVLFELMKGIPFVFHTDGVSFIFTFFTSVIWTGACWFAYRYMEHEGDEKRYFGFYLLCYGVLVALDFSGNLVTMYFFYEFMTLTSMPMVLHNLRKESIMAALKYLFYSMCGAYLALFGVFILTKYADSTGFIAGGSLDMTMVQGHETIILIAVFCMIVGFGAKAGMFPLHAWLPTAHPVAPAPASAVLSAVIVKAGVLAVIRSVYYVCDPNMIRGTWVQTVWMSLALLTVFMGSLLAFREKLFKKRLAYSTVSQVSYIMFGLSCLSVTGFTGAMLHTVFHAFIKAVLFLCAGTFIFRTGRTGVDEYEGIGKEMPLTLWGYTIASLGLIGIPPTSGFISKWYLAQGALEGGIGVFAYLGPAILLISALLTAGYLLPITMRGFLPGRKVIGFEKGGKRADYDKMTAAVILLAVFTVLFGLFPNVLVDFVGAIAQTVL